MRGRNRFDKNVKHKPMDKKRSLQEIFNEIGNLTDNDYGANDKGGKIHTYLETYDKLFEPFRNGCAILEIGLAMGDSLKLWNKYFYNSYIYGIDISVVFDRKEIEGYHKYNGNNVFVIEQDATKPAILDTINNIEFNICIDDGDHQTQSQIDTFNILKSKMKKGSIYIIEDLLSLDTERERYLALSENAEIIDMRSNGRFDNALVIIRF